MTTRIVLTVAIVLARPLAAPAELTIAEQRCQQRASKVMVKFGVDVAKCGIRCQRGARGGLNPITDCYAPYAGATLACLTDPLRGAQARAIEHFRRACDPDVNPSADCPECYAGGDCALAAIDRVFGVQGQLDSLGAGLFCERQPTPPEARCMDGTTTGLVMFAKALHKCFDQCFKRARASAMPSHASDACTKATDPVLTDCLSSRAYGKAIARIDAACTPPRGSPPPCLLQSGPMNGSQWTNLIGLAAMGNIPIKYCGSPSGAFVE
jgi:hypothetical protein